MMTEKERKEAIIEWENFLKVTTAEYKAQLDNNKQFKKLEWGGNVVPYDYHDGFVDAANLFGTRQLISFTNEKCSCHVCTSNRKKLEIEYINKLIDKYNALGINTSFNPNNYLRLPYPNPPN